jgi:hypothetical protein
MQEVHLTGLLERSSSEECTWMDLLIMLLCTLTGANRKTIIEWDKELPSPIADEQGLEHGGIKNGYLYKIYNNEQLTQAQHSKLGINIGVTKN